MRILAAVLLACLATAARADWERVDEQGAASFYVDPASIVRMGQLFRVSVLQDLARPEAGARSRLVLYEVDCSGLGIRSLSAIEFSEPMARGSRVNTWERESDWLWVLTPRTGRLIAVHTPFAAIVRRVCRR